MLMTMLAVFIANVLLGLPLFICLMSTALIGFFFIDPSMIFRMMPQQFFAGINVFSLMAIPLFILSGNLMNAAGLTPKLIDFAKALVGHLRGGLGYVNVVSSIFFAGVNGSAVADTSALGSLLVPAMKKDGYSASYAAGLTAGSSLIGPIIPPSIFMILYSSVTNTSVGDLFLAGVIPGLLLGVAFMVVNYLYARNARIAVSPNKPSFAGVFSAMIIAIPALLAPLIIVSSIVFGLVTPTESGVLIVLYSLLVGLLSGMLNLEKIASAIKETASLTCAIFVIIGASSIVSWELAYAQVPSSFVSLLTPYLHSPTIILLCISLITFITGMLMEEVSALMLLTPVFAPVALQAGVDPVHLGIIITMNITIALITPPMGACVYVAAAVSKIELIDMFKSIWPFVGLAMLVLILLIFFPSLTLFLPQAFK